MSTFSNQATLSYNTSVINSNVVTGEIQQVLTVQKDSVVDEYVANDVLTYVISLVNSGTTAYTNLTISDDLGAYIFGGTTVTPMTSVPESVLFYVNGTLQDAPTVVAGPPLVISGLSVPAGGSAVLIYRAALNSYAPLDVGSEITNTATISGDGVLSDIQTSETVVVSNSPNLTITKSVNPQTVVENGQLTYTFIIENSGNAPATAGDNAVITDTFDPVLESIQVNFNGNAWVPPTNYTYNTATGAFASVAGQVTVPAATYTQDPTTGVWTVTPGVSVLTISGTI